MMGNNRTMTMLFAAGGLLLGAIQFLRMRQRPRGMSRIWHGLTEAFDYVQDNSGRLVQQSQRMYRRAKRRVV